MNITIYTTTTTKLKIIENLSIGERRNPKGPLIVSLFNEKINPKLSKLREVGDHFLPVIILLLSLF